MKLKMISLVLMLFSYSAYCQINTTLFGLSLTLEKLEEAIKFNSVLNANNVIDIMSSNWDNSVFNPYKEVKVQFPLQITFKDSVYNSPILKEKVVTSRYGWRWRRAHGGIDIDLVQGDDVVSMLDGVVRFAKYNSGHGKLVIVRHFNGLETAYAHLSSIRVKANDTVVGGEILGKGGATGNARGSHLHLITSYQGVPINPEYLFDFNGTDSIRSNEIWVTNRWATPYLHSSKKQTKLELLISEEEALASLEREKKVYIVKSGDTLSRISNRNSVSIRSICIANNIKSTSLLRIGQKLYID
ncbi:MAG: peptidase [Bacteroidetes bacterium]|nr:MAG: peptidase [Bacteroidota bacterium]